MKRVINRPANSPVQRSVTGYFKRARSKVPLYALLLGVTVVWGAPLLWMFVTSIKPESEIFRYPLEWIPEQPTVQHYTDVFQRFAISAWFRNSFFVAVITTLVTLVTASLAAYPLARREFPGKRLLIIVILTTFILPFEILLVPLFLGLSRFGVSDTYFSLSVPMAANAFGVFLLMQFFKTIPAELEDAAAIDGCSGFGFFWRILLPLSVPAMVTVALFAFMASWNNFFWPLIVTNSDATRTLPVGLVTLVSGNAMSMRFGTTMAAAVVATVPAVIVFLALQRYFVKGIATTGLK